MSSSYPEYNLVIQLMSFLNVIVKRTKVAVVYRASSIYAI